MNDFAVEIVVETKTGTAAASHRSQQFLLLESIFIHSCHHLPIVGSARALILNIQCYSFRSEQSTTLGRNFHTCELRRKMDHVPNFTFCCCCWLPAVFASSSSSYSPMLLLNGKVCSSSRTSEVVEVVSQSPAAVVLSSPKHEQNMLSQNNRHRCAGRHYFAKNLLINTSKT